MSGAELKQRLAAILAADVASYSRLMAADERGTVADLDTARGIFKAQIETNQGRVIDMAGDSVLAVFETAIGAVSAAIAIQQKLKTTAADTREDGRMRFRIGVHLGDVIEKPDGTIYGDGVNIAARLEGLAEPSGVMVSDAVRGAVKGKVSVAFEDQGEQKVKNIAEPVRAYRVKLEGDATKTTGEVGENDLTLPNKPSIAVLPFANMSGDPEQEYFTDGVTEDIITELSRFHSLFVIARNSSFTYKGKAVGVRTVAKELGVRYVLEGSIRKASNRIRVTGQLADALSGKHIWAERYDRVLEDIFEVQEELTHNIVMAIAPQIEAAELEKVRRRRPESLSAYEIALRASTKAGEAYTKSDRELRDEAIHDAQEALAIDPRSTLALNALAFAQWQHVVLGTAADREATWQEGIAAATRAIEADRSESLGYAFKGLLLAYASDRDRMDDALANVRRARELNPHHIVPLIALGFCEVIAGNSEKATEYLQQVLRLSPRDPLQFHIHNLLAMASFCIGQYANGVEYALLGVREAPGGAAQHVHLAVNYVGLGEIAKAKAALEEARRVAPELVQWGLAGGSVYRKPMHQRRVNIFTRVAAGLEDPSAANAFR